MCIRDRSYVDHLKSLAAEDENIILTGPLYGDELAEILTNAGGFVTSSHLEGLPTALIEAGRAALPILASDISPHCEILNTDSGIDGRRIYSTGDPKELGDLMTMISEHHAEELFGAKLLAAELDERYAPARTAEVHEHAYVSAIAHRHRR